MKFTVKEEFPYDPELVLESLIDLDIISTWLPNTTKIEPLTEGPVRVGSQWRVWRRIKGHEANEVFEIVALAPDHVKLFVDGKKGSSGSGNYLYSIHINHIPYGSEVTIQVEIDGGNWFTRLIGSFFMKSFEESSQADLRALQAFLKSLNLPQK